MISVGWKDTFMVLWWFVLMWWFLMKLLTVFLITLNYQVGFWFINYFIYCISWRKSTRTLKTLYVENVESEMDGPSYSTKSSVFSWCNTMFSSSVAAYDNRWNEAIKVVIVLAVLNIKNDQQSPLFFEQPVHLISVFEFMAMIQGWFGNHGASAGVLKIFLCFVNQWHVQCLYRF